MPDTSSFPLIPRDVLKDIYVVMSRISAVDVAIRQGLKAGRFHFNYWPMTGQEGIPASLSPLLSREDYLVTTYRGVHDHVAKGVPLREYFAEALGRKQGLNKGKGGPLHLSHPPSGAMLTTAIVGAGTPVANGLAFAARFRGTDRIAVVCFGDGATSIGAVHEAINLAGAWKLPVLFLLSNNGMGEYTPVAEYTATKHFVDRAPGYGIRGDRADGNDVQEMYWKARDAVAYIRAGKGPVLFEAMTARLGPHHGFLAPEHLNKEQLDAARQKAPIPRARSLLIERGICSVAELDDIDAIEKRAVNEALEWALTCDPADLGEVERDVYAGDVQPRAGIYVRHAERESAYTGDTQDLTMGGAICDAMDAAMSADREVVLMGEDVGHPGGLQKTSQDLIKKHGRDRVLSTPIAESAIIGAGIGSALVGMRPICEIMYSDFLAVCMDQIANHAAKQRFMSGGISNLPMTIRVMIGPSPLGGSGAQHTQSFEAWLLHVPGMKVVYPSTAREAKGLLMSCIHDDDPCVHLESTRLMHTQRGAVPTGDYRIPIGVADVKRTGTDLSIITYGWQVHESLAAATELAKEGIDVEVVDLRTLMPLDYPTMFESVTKTGRVLVVTAATQFCGMSGEIASTVAEVLHRELKAPVSRLGANYAPIGYARALEQAQLPHAGTIATRVRQIMKI